MVWVDVFSLFALRWKDVFVGVSRGITAKKCDFSI